MANLDAPQEALMVMGYAQAAFPRRSGPGWGGAAQDS
jgi:hypothetical protein